MMKRTVIYISVTGLLICLLASCSTTSRLEENDVLYTGVRKINIESADGEKVAPKVEDDIKEPLSVKPNNPLYAPYWRTPLPIGLWAWNHMYTEKQKGLKWKMYKRFSKTPVLIGDVLPDRRVSLVEDMLDNQGYFGSSAEYEILPMKNTKKAKLNYHITVAEPWSYSNISLPAVAGPVTGRISELSEGSLLYVGQQYNVDTLRAERIRITNILREESYYYFRPEYIEYLADTLQEKKKVDLRMVMAEGIPPEAMKPYKVGHVSIELSNPERGKADSTEYNGIKIYYQEPLNLRPKILTQALTIKPDEPSRVSDINNTLTNLSKLGVFRYVNMAVTPLDSLKGTDAVDMTITAAFDSPMDADFEIDFSTKSSSFMGPGVAFGLRHKNFFKGGEHFSVKFNAAYEWQTGNTSSQVNSSTINSYEIGVNTSLMVPRLLVPKFIPQSKRFDSKTNFQLGVSLMNRPNFFTMLSATGSLSYDFQSSRTSFHNLTPFRLTYNNMLRTTGEFEETLEENKALKQSFMNQFIPAFSYTYTMDKTFGPEHRKRIIWQTTVTEAGNLIAGIQALAGQNAPRQMLGTNYSQFVKGTTELKYYHQVGFKNMIAARFMAGAGYAYENSQYLPYTEQFSIGGMNSIRAFTVRSVGPGGNQPNTGKYGYFDQTGEFKLEANVEYRFNLAGGLYGALFLDAGNIWLLRDDPDRPDGKLGRGDFLDQIALGTGFGLRFDMTFLVIRTDLGIGLHLPYDTGKSGYYNIPKFKDGLGFHLAVGYPF